MINLAIVAPYKSAYSETFIQAHKRITGTKTFYYYGGWMPVDLEGYGKLVDPRSLRSKLNGFVQRRWLGNSMSNDEIGLLRSFKKNKIHCVLAEYGPSGAAVMEICHKLKIPLVTYFFGFDAFEHATLNEYSERYHRLFEIAHVCIGVSQTICDQLIQLGCDLTKIRYLPCPPNDLFFSCSPGIEPTILAVGRFVDKKAPYYTILAFKKVLESISDAKLIMIGDGPLLNCCKNLSRQLQIQNSIEFVNPVPPKELSKYYSKAKIFVQHSIIAENGDREGTPVAILEAGAAALPVVSTFHSGIPEVVVQGETGLLSEEHDVQSMSDNLITLLSDRRRAETLGQNARTRIANFFTMESHLTELHEIILKVTYT